MHVNGIEACQLAEVGTESSAQRGHVGSVSSVSSPFSDAWHGPRACSGCLDSVTDAGHVHRRCCVRVM